MELALIAAGLSLIYMVGGFIIHRLVLIPLWRWGERNAESVENNAHPPKNALQWRWFYLTALVVLLGISILATTTGLEIREDQQTRQDFPTSTGTITRSEAVANIRDTQMSMVGDVVETQYNVFIEYEYTVDEMTYTNNKIVLDERISGQARLFDKADADALIKKYPLAKTVQVTYDPDDPMRAGLEVKEENAAFGIGLIGGLISGALSGLVFLPFIIYNH